MCKLNTKASFNYFFERSEKENRVDFTVLKALKLVYVAHGLCLAKLDVPLIKDEVQAWTNGPVIPSLYEDLQGFKGTRPISIPFFKDIIIAKEVIQENSNRDLTIMTDALPIIDYKKNLSEKQIKILEEVWNRLGKYSGEALSEKTHEKGTPWYTAFYDKEKGRFSSIDAELLKQHYKDRDNDPAFWDCSIYECNFS